MKIIKILIVGNSLVPQDSLPVRLLLDLKAAFPKITFKEIDGVENIEDEGRDLVLIDSAQGIDEIKIITDLDSIEISKIYNMHDFDLGMSLKLLKKIGKIDSVLIFALPQKMPKARAKEELIRLMSNIYK